MSDLTRETKNLAKHSSIYAIGNLLERITAFLLLPLYTRYLTPADYGIKELVGISSDIVVILIASGIANAIYRFYFEYEEEEDRNQVISSAYLTLGVLTAAAIVVLYLFSRPLAGLILDDPDLNIYLVVPFTSLWFQILNNISRHYLRARQKSLLVITYSLIQLLVSVGLNIYFIVVVRLGVLGILYSVLIVSVLIFLTMTLPVIAKVGLSFSRNKTMEMIRFGLPLVPSTLGGFVVHASDRFFIKSFVSLSEAGIYSLGYRLGGMPGTFVVQPFNQTWLPRRFEISKQPDSEIIFGRIFTYYLLVLMTAGLGVSVLARDIVILMADPKFWGAYKVVPLLVVSNLLFSLHYHLHFGLILAKKTKILAAINLSNGFLILIANWLLIPRFGMFGAVYATILAFIYKDSLTWYFSKKYFRPRFEARRITILLIAALTVYLASTMIRVGDILLDILLHTLMVGLFPLILLSVPFFTPSEKDRARQFIRKVFSRLRPQIK